MPVQCECVRCGYQGVVDDAYAGETLPCPHCGQGITIPVGFPAEPTGPPQLKKSRVSSSPLFLPGFLLAILGFGVVFVITGLMVVTAVRRPMMVRQARAQIEKLESELLAYSVQCGRFPTSDEGLEALLVESWGRRAHEGPLPLDPWGQPYQYEFPGPHNEVRPDVWSLGPDGKNGSEDDIGNWEESDTPPPLQQTKRTTPAAKRKIPVENDSSDNMGPFELSPGVMSVIRHPFRPQGESLAPTAPLRRTT